MTNWRGWVRLPFDNWPSRIYLLLVLAAVAFFVVDATLVEHEDASFAGVYMIILTLPVSLLAVAVPVVGIVLGALVNATIIGAITRLVRRTGRRG